MTNKAYVDNEKLTKELDVYAADYREAVKNNKPKPKISEYIGSAIILTANRLSLKPKFINYTYREEMISDGIENCILYIHNFNSKTISKRTGKQSVGAFPYITQIIYYSFLRRIQKEKKQEMIKYQCIKQANISGLFSGKTSEVNGEREAHRDFMDSLQVSMSGELKEESVKKPKRKRKVTSIEDI